MTEISPIRNRFESHPLHQELENWKARFASESPENSRELPDEARSAFIRTKYIVREVALRLKKVSPILVSFTALDAINNQLSKLQSQWTNFCNDPAGQYSGLQGPTDNIAAQLPNLPRNPEESAWEQNTSDINEEFEQILETVTSKAESVSSLSADTQTKFSQLQEKFEELKTEIQSQKTRLDQMLTQHSETFNKSEQDRTKLFNDTLTEHKTKLEEFSDEFAQALEETLKQASDDIATKKSETESIANELTENIQKQLDRAEEIVGTIVTTSMSGNYERIAGREFWNAQLFRGIAMIAFVAMGGIIIWTVSSSGIGGTDIQWGTFAFRLSLGLAFLIPGFYCAREAGRHWTNEKHNRRLALELAAFRPFIKELPENKQQEIIERKADEYFGKAALITSEEDSLQLLAKGIGGDQPSKILKEVLSFVERIVKLR